eukprot:CAMPEP_0181300980 /NCGR_PEP_ID=MMETSP1101-20121128/7181_1 /TAXON_ID=46948 /ORGANISM="Rhodomonas abbreviata, Strain Caron Lab Isolate" /LENGTH=162 /DNA_ID=CAMNT_0023406257 /DNA_START=794 /DNA_END=1282 /DNA_ORIENTATION=+
MMQMFLAGVISSCFGAVFNATLQFHRRKEWYMQVTKKRHKIAARSFQEGGVSPLSVLGESMERKTEQLSRGIPTTRPRRRWKRAMPLDNVQEREGEHSEDDVTDGAEDARRESASFNVDTQRDHTITPWNSAERERCDSPRSERDYASDCSWQSLDDQDNSD